MKKTTINEAKNTNYSIREAFKFAFKIDPYSDEVGRDVARAWKNKFLVYLRNE